MHRASWLLGLFLAAASCGKEDTPAKSAAPASVPTKSGGGKIAVKAFLTDADAKQLGYERRVERMCTPEMVDVSVEKGSEGVRIQLFPGDKGGRYANSLMANQMLAKDGMGTVTEESRHGSKGFLFVPKDGKVPLELAFLKGDAWCVINVNLAGVPEMTPKKAEEIGRRIADFCAKKLP